MFLGNLPNSSKERNAQSKMHTFLAKKNNIVARIKRLELHTLLWGVVSAIYA